MAGLSGVANPPDQPKVCAACGEKVVKTRDSAMFYYDLTPAKAHYTLHADCIQRYMSR